MRPRLCKALGSSDAPGHTVGTSVVLLRSWNGSIVAGRAITQRATSLLPGGGVAAMAMRPASPTPLPSTSAWITR
jgi:hypothetical protein